ncbi:PEP-CTERM sorting domain-containing protein [Chlorobaculum sp. 24CR]|uniref:PEP-CTERM sorting domain-containing protein n=1 Tax=Chlorobaculum sp. 24CR TaxID=2508878 RepID=UPI00100A4E00|nr:PEP-CTERM sorting domain-containing protein [Chlorobaculum sp. 24CR]RXK85152.1 PEP-CTERM sorting domain-containing protein [Chlorobaculum sp. 24CR]
MKKLLSLLFVAGMLWSNQALAAVSYINVNYTSIGGGGYTGAAEIGKAGDTWNTIGLGRSTSIDNTTSNLFDVNGDATGVSVRTTGTADDIGGWVATGGDVNGFHGTSYEGLMDGYLFAYGATAGGTITFSGLSAGTPYDVYLYSEGDSATDGRQLGVTVNGSYYTTSPSVAVADSFIAGQNYLLIHATTDAIGNLAIGYNQAALEANINGVQIAAVPEPGTIVLLGVGGLAVAALKKRKELETSEA